VAEVTIRELRNRGGDVVERVLGGESLVVTRAGVPVAELRPVRPAGLDVRALLERWRSLPYVDPAALRADVDRYVDPSL
jgi:prevent-host-death family protein